MSSCSCSVAKEKGLFGRCFNNCVHTQCVSKKIATGMNIFFAFKKICQQCVFAIALIRAGVAVQGPHVVYKIKFKEITKELLNLCNR